MIFECKNYKGAIPESEITDFSDKIGRIFQHSAKGVVVVSSRLQSGAESIARNRKMGIVKFEEHGFEIKADRKRSMCEEERFLAAQIFKNERSVKRLKFSAIYDGKLYGSIEQFLRCLDPEQPDDGKFANDGVNGSVPYIREEFIRNFAQQFLEQISYVGGAVDLNKICSKLDLYLQFAERSEYDGDGNLILGSVNFDRKSIQIYSHDDKNQERFTIAHEIGHFCLKHDQYLRSEFIVERDLIIRDESDSGFNYERLEYQADMFASYLILLNDVFLRKTAEFRSDLGIEDRGHGYIFVDDQPCNYVPYNQLLQGLSSYFEVSKQTIEIQYEKQGMLTDQRNKPGSFSVPPITSSRNFLPEY